MSASIENAMNDYMNAIQENYAKWIGVNLDEVSENMIREFKASYTSGKKYLRVVTKSAGQESAHSFVVNTHNDSKFPYGTILMAASWKAPARNKARGSVFEDVSHISWTGAL